MAAGKRHLIIPVFIPFAGCPHRCVFCNQEDITGSQEMPGPGEVSDTVEKHLSTWKGGGSREVAFYGGTFTALEPELQRIYLSAVGPYLEKGLIDGIRVSTRPDYVSAENVEFLKGHGVKTVELGVQSMDDGILKLSARGHSSGDTVRAARAVKRGGLRLGLQLMPGLPGDTFKSALKTATGAAALGPDFVRIYPVLVIKGTALHDMYLRGLYRPWPLDDMVSLCRGICRIFKEHDIRVIRMGLHPSEELRAGFVAGPFHPSFRQLVEKGL